MKRSAKDVAQYIVNYHIEAEAPITNMKLQKLLYLVWVQHYRKTGRYLFDDEIVAWPLGPVVPSVYYDYSPYGADMIFRHRLVEIPWVEAYALDSYLVEYEWAQARDLIEMTTRKGGAWDKVYRDGNGRDDTISFETIIKLDCDQRKEKGNMFGYKKDVEAKVERDLEDELMTKADKAAVLAHEYAIDVLKRAREGSITTSDRDVLPIILETLLIKPSDIDCLDIELEDYDDDDDDDDDDTDEVTDEDYEKAKSELKDAFTILSEALDDFKEAISR